MWLLVSHTISQHAATMIRPLGALLVLPWIGLSSPLLLLAFAALFVPLLGATASPGNLTLGLALTELAHGLALGLVAAAPVWAASLAGRLGDRGAELPGTPLERLYTAAGLATFGVVGGPFLLARAILQSFAHAPLGAPLIDVNAPLRSLTIIVRSALDLAGPLVAAILVATVVRVLAARLAPRSLVGGGLVLQPVLVLTAALVASAGLLATLARMHGH